MLALFLIVILVYGTSTRKIFRQQSVYHQVRIATNGRSEVGVEIECQSVVADVVRRVNGLSHGAYGNGRDQIFFRLVLDVVQKRIDALAYLHITTCGA